jgi:hypothetical protein
MFAASRPAIHAQSTINRATDDCSHVDNERVRAMTE